MLSCAVGKLLGAVDDLNEKYYGEAKETLMTKATRRSTMTACQRGTLHRMRVVQAALALTDRRVASATGMTVKNYQAGNLHPGAARRFAKAFDVSIHWLVRGEGAEIKPHLSRAKGKVSILPVHGPKNRLWQERDREMNQSSGEKGTG
jgi:hypothetical protein